MFGVKLEREPIKVEELSLSAQLAKDAKELLNYGGLAEAIEARTERASALVEIQSVFARLGIEPFVSETVERYKEKRRRKEVRRQSGEYHTAIGSWSREYLPNYRKPVPEFVLARAVELKRELPTAEFYVDALSVEQRPIPDPFLVMRYRGVELYLEVWDEPDFEGRKTV